MKEFVIFDEETGHPNGKKYSSEFVSKYNDALSIMRGFIREHEDDLSQVEIGLVGEYISSFTIEVSSWAKMHSNRRKIEKQNTAT